MARLLKSIHCSIWKPRRIVFRYKNERWDIFESLRPWDIREAIKIGLQRIEDAVPGTLEKAAELDDQNWRNNKRRTRGYIAEASELLYIDSPHLQAQSESVAGYYFVTNIPWKDVPHILRLACKAAGIEYGTLSDISF